MKPDLSYRLNPSRAIWIRGRISDDLVDQVAPEILKLKAEDSDPISVFINSPGGSIRCLDIIEGLLKAPGPTGATCRIITAAVGNAFSAAATLLALGDYAVAYSVGSLIHFHGTRYGEVEDVTVESATGHAESLRRRNEATAYRIAVVALPRLFFKYTLLTDEFARHQEGNPNCKTPIDCFYHAIGERLTPPAKRVVQKAWTRFQQIKTLTSEVLDPVQRDLESKKIENNSVEYEILKRAIDYEFNELRKRRLSGIGQPELGKMVEDYLILRDYHAGEHNHLLGEVATKFGFDLLTPEEAAEFTALQSGGSEEKIKFWSHQKLRERIQPFWYLALSLCRYLQEEENQLTPSDAYWLGIVDELIGENLPNLRSIAESPDESPGEAG